jgi:hypothetical protein
VVVAGAQPVHVPACLCHGGGDMMMVFPVAFFCIVAKNGPIPLLVTDMGVENLVVYYLVLWANFRPIYSTLRATAGRIKRLVYVRRPRNFAV